MDCREIIERFKKMANPRNVEGMAKFGIKPKAEVFGIPIPEVRKIAKIIKKDHKLALQLFDSGIHEAKILAGLVAKPEKLTEKQIAKWIKAFDSWDVVDQICMNLFDKSKIAIRKIPDFAKKKAEFEKRTAFSLMAALAVHDKKMSDKDFIKFFPLIKRAALDERNFVKKAVNWALRGIGKRNKNLNKEAIKLAILLRAGQAKSEKWIGGNALLELTSPAVQKRLLKAKK